MHGAISWGFRVIKKTTGDGITKVQWDLPENDDELRSALKALADAKFEGNFARASEIAARVASRILDESNGVLTAGDSPEFFARSILQGIRVAHSAIADGNADLAAMMAFHAGVAWERARMKWLWEEDAERGQKVAGGSSNSAHETNKRHVVLRKKRFERLAELIPSMGVDNAARQCEGEGLGGWQGIVRQYNRFNKNQDT